jgi:integrase
MKATPKNQVDPEPRAITPKPANTRTRGNGRGTLYKYTKGRYRWQFRNADGKVLASGISPDKSSAEKALSRVITERERGTLANPDRVTLREYGETYLERQSNVRPQTLRLYRCELEYALDLIGNKQLRTITYKTIVDTLTTLSKKGMSGTYRAGKPMSSRTLDKVRLRLRAVFSEAVRDQLIYVNPTDAVRRVKGIDDPEDMGGVALDFPEAARLQEIGEALHAAGQCRLWAAVFTSLSIGLRRGEVMALRWQDLDLEAGVLHVRQNLTVHNNELQLGKPKTQKAVREIPLPASLTAALKRHKAEQALERKENGQSWTDTGAVFATELGTYTHPDNMNRTVRVLGEWSTPGALERKRKDKSGQVVMSVLTLEQRMLAIPRPHRAALTAAIMAGNRLPEISPHDLRHTAGTLMLRRRVPVEVVSRILGHARVSITLDVYRHVLESEKRSEMVDLFAAPIPTRAAVTAPLN